MFLILDVSKVFILMPFINLNDFDYKYVEPNNYKNYKLLLKQIKRVKEKIRAIEHGIYKDKLTKAGKQRYEDYPVLLIFLEGLLK